MNKFENIKKFALIIFLASVTQVSVAGFTTVYLLGDSLSDQGNLFTSTELLVGEGNGVPASDHYYAGRFSNAENYVDFLSRNLGIEINASIMWGNNFAYGGTRTDYNRVEDDFSKPFPVNILCQNGMIGPSGCDYGMPPFFGFDPGIKPWSLELQVEDFQSRGIMDPDALYIVFSGANDLADLTAIVARFGGDPETFIPPFIEKVVGGISSGIAAFVAVGGKDIIVANAPNLGVVPSVTRFGPQFSALATGLSEQYNQALMAMLAQWEGQTNIILFDTFSLITEVVHAPDDYGFSNVTEACYSGFVGPAGPDDTVCDEPDAYAFWDVEHPTSAFHALMAEFMLATAAEDILNDLMMRVAMLDLHNGFKRSLAAKLDAAMLKLLNNNSNASVRGSLRAFIKSIKAQTGKKIAANDAAILIQRAKRTIALLK